MKKLNNKGFAISTMLYGILTIIIVILMLLLNIMRSSYNKENIAVEDISYYLDDCIKKQVALESCYKMSDDETSEECADAYKAYTTCLGLNKNNIVTGSVAKLNELAVDLGDSSDTGLIIDSTITKEAATNKRYFYIGKSPQNYIIINNIEARIMSIETDGTIKVIVKDIKNMQLDKAGNTNWQNSTLMNELMLEYNNMEYKSKFTKGTFYIDNFYKSKKIDINYEQHFMKEKDKSYYGLPNIFDYLNASSNILGKNNDACRLLTYGFNYYIDDPVGTRNCRGESNWMDDSNNCYWTTTKYIDGDSIKYLTYSRDGIVAKDPTESCSASMILVLKANTTVETTGTGSKDNPFIVDLR